MNLLNKKNKILLSVILSVILLIGIICLLQFYISHINFGFSPDYKRVTLTESTDYDTIFLQTGLGKPAAEKLINEDRFDDILEAQDQFFKNDKVLCNPLMSIFTREDRLENELITFYDLQPGDIILSLSTHSLGWRHGHAGVVLDQYNTVESIMLGTDSSKENIRYWQDYSTVAVLRVKGKTAEERQRAADFTKANLIGKRYSVFSGFGIKKDPDYNKDSFSLHCSYLAWYAWNNFNVDLDSDGGRLVTSNDILHSDKVEIVQLYGINPNDFI